MVAEADGRIVGMVNVDVGRFGSGRHRHARRRRLARSAASDRASCMRPSTWGARRGAAQALPRGLPTNVAAIALYRECGFVEEGLRLEQYRRASGELWDSLAVGLLL